MTTGINLNKKIPDHWFEPVILRIQKKGDKFHMKIIEELFW